MSPRTPLKRPSPAQRYNSLATPSYFVVMCDFGRAREAVVDPEATRRDVIARLVSGEYDNVLFIHEIADGVTDVTLELQLAASALIARAA